MQFSYEYPVFCERLVLVDSGGLGSRSTRCYGRRRCQARSWHSRLSPTRVARVGEAIGQALGRLGLELGHDLAEMTRGYASLSDAEARRAFLHSVRAVIDLGGQRVNATDRLYLAQMIPTLIVWGRRDPLSRSSMPWAPIGGCAAAGSNLRSHRPFPPARDGRFASAASSGTSSTASTRPSSTSRTTTCGCSASECSRTAGGSCGPRRAVVVVREGVASDQACAPATPSEAEGMNIRSMVRVIRKCLQTGLF